VVVFGFVVCAAAAWLLRQTPLLYPACAVACINAAVAAASMAAARGGAGIPRWLTALRHVTTALGGFFLFVWFSLP
jgi:hypothetical protein